MRLTREHGVRRVADDDGAALGPEFEWSDVSDSPSPNVGDMTLKPGLLSMMAS